jgi:hypothetical protein
VDPFAAALGNSASGAQYIVSTWQIGGPFQSAVLAAPRVGFPVEGPDYLSVSAGDARTPGSDTAFYGCGSGLFFPETLCNQGGLGISLAVPVDAGELSFDYRFWEVDYYPFLDPFRVILTPAGGEPVLVAYSDLFTEFGVKGGPAFAWSPTLRHVALDLVPYRGQTVTLEFIAANARDNAWPSGALVDDLTVTRVDTTAPAVTFLVPQPYQFFRGTVEFQAQVVDDFTGVAWVAFQVRLPDGTPVADLPVTGLGDLYTGAFDTAGVFDGGYQLCVGAADAVGNAGTACQPFSVDNTNPFVKITNPADGSYLKSWVDITATAEDQGSGMDLIELFVNDLQIGSCAFAGQAVATCTVPFDTTTLGADGLFQIVARGADRVGNVRDDALKAIADNTAPARFLVSPLPGQTVGDSVTVAVDVKDPNFAEVSCWLDGEPVFQAQSPAYSKVVSTLGLLDGLHTVTCVATDLAGNAGTESAQFKVKNWTEDLDPNTLNLKSSGGSLSITLYVEGQNVSLLAPLLSQVAAVVPGGAPVPATPHASGSDADGDGVPDLTVKFDRQALIAAVKQGIAAGAIDPSRPLTVAFTVQGAWFGEDAIAVLAK